MKAFVASIFFSLLTIVIGDTSLFSRPIMRSEMKSFRGALPGEPLCDELREMWRFSRRQSRAAEVTNEIPTYRDPFAHNVWEPLPRLRSVLQRPPLRPWSPPIYGRIARRPDLFPPPPSSFDKLYRELRPNYRNDDQSDRILDDEDDYEVPVRARSPRFYQLNSNSPYGKFDRVKQKIIAERAKDLSYKKVKPGEWQSGKNGQEQNKEEVNGQNSNYNRYSTEEEGKADKLRLVKGGFELDTPSGSERFRKPLRRSSAYTWMDPSFDRGYWPVE